MNNYLLGKDPFPFDLLYWNSDATRMPAKMHTFYLRNMYIKNLLTKPGGITLGGEPIDVSKDRIAGVFRVHDRRPHRALEEHLHGGEAAQRAGEILSGGSGHIAGVVNPPVANKYCHWTNDAMPATADEWLASAQRHEGSWWHEWDAWVSQFGGDKVPARMPGDGKLKVLEDAPGSYVKLRLGGSTSGTAPSTVTAANDPTLQPPKPTKQSKGPKKTPSE